MQGRNSTKEKKSKHEGGMIKEIQNKMARKRREKEINERTQM